MGYVDVTIVWVTDILSKLESFYRLGSYGYWNYKLESKNNYKSTYYL